MLALALGAVACSPAARAPLAPLAPVDEERIARREICVGSSVASAGDPPAVLYYRAVRLDAQHLAVGYFAIFSEERPWGRNWMTWTVVPALAIDSVYSHTLLVGPGLQRVMYGRGDVEGVAVIYETNESGPELRVDHALADDGDHHDVTLTRADVLAIDGERPVFYASSWSHQLGARGLRSTSELAELRCYVGASLRPLPDDLARDYRIESRARPAHVERLPHP